MLRLLAPAAAALALVSVITDDTRLDNDIVLVAPERAEPGVAIALRALLYAGLNKPEGPSLIHAATQVVLKAGEGRVLAKSELRTGHGPSLEGQLRVPGGARGKLRLVATAWVGDQKVEVERQLIVETQEPSVLVPRALGPLQQLSLGPLRIREGAIGPSVSSVRVAGGACVPEELCELLVHVEPAVVLEVATTASVTVEQGPPRTAVASVFAVRVRTHGPEANLELRFAGEPAPDAIAPNAIAAARSVRLPVALGADAMTVERVVLVAPALPSLALTGQVARGIADVFAKDRWRSSTTLRTSAAKPLPIDALVPGTYRAQLRRDPFESASAAVRTFYVRAPGETDAGVLRALAQQVAARERGMKPDERDVLASRLAAESDQTAAIDFDMGSRYLLAALDDGIYRLPAPTSGYPLARKRAVEHREDVRMLALSILALAAASLVLLLVQRGLLASDQAASLLRASGTGDADVRREQLRMTLRVVGAALAVLLVFCAIALYLIVRGQAL